MQPVGLRPPNIGLGVGPAGGQVPLVAAGQGSPIRAAPGAAGGTVPQAATGGRFTAFGGQGQRLGGTS